jgi:hypothetical protein
VRHRAAWASCAIACSSPRAYALECLAGGGRAGALQRRHALAVAALFDTAYEEYFTGRGGVDGGCAAADRPRPRTRRLAGPAARAAEDELRIGTTFAGSRRRCTWAAAGRCLGPPPVRTARGLQLQAWITSCVL